jgi:hypothetical protein
MGWRATGQRVRDWFARTRSSNLSPVPGVLLLSHVSSAPRETPIVLQPLRSRLVSTATSAERPRDVRPQTRNWRRRILLRKGERIHIDLVNQCDTCSLAILDTDGFVICWYDDLPDGDTPVGEVIDHHVAQFYAPTHLAGVLACEHLRRAESYGSSMQTGWRRQPGGTAFWATTEIRPFVLRDGRVQGFMHVIRATDGPQPCAGPIDSRSYFYVAPHSRRSVHCADEDQSKMGAQSFERDARRPLRTVHV